MRSAEIAKYAACYREPGYRQTEDRQEFVRRWLEGGQGSLLDVGTGRGETLGIARELGYGPAQGTEVVPYLITDGIVYAEAHALPFDDGAFDTVTCFDVLEHLLYEDQAPALREFHRVARHRLVLTAANYPTQRDGVELHVGYRDNDNWEALIRECCPGTVTRLGWCGTAEGWQVHVRK